MLPSWLISTYAASAASVKSRRIAETKRIPFESSAGQGDPDLRMTHFVLD